MILSSHLILLIISGYTLVVDCMPSPQEASVSLDDILQAAGNDSSRYGTNSGPVDQSALCNVFGGPDCQNNGNNANAEINNRPEYDTNDDDYLTDPDVGNPTVKVSKKSDNCSYFEEFGFECVPYYNCKDGVIITDGDSLFDIRGNFGPRSGLTSVKLDPLSSKCPSYLEVCCASDPDYVDYDFTTLVPPSTERPVTKAPTTLAPTKRPDYPGPNNNNNNNNDCFGASCPYRQRCGRHNPGGLGVRIQNLDKFSGGTQFAEWPHMCAILRKSQQNGREINLYVGGASLIAPGILLTAAHVFK